MASSYKILNEDNTLNIWVTSLLMVVSAVANITVLVLLLRKKNAGKASRLDLILIHLAIADLMVTFLRMPVHIAWAAVGAWLYGNLMCRAMMFASLFGLYLSSFVVICIAVDRYYAVLKPLNVSWEARLPRVLGGAWCGAVLASVPQAIVFHTETHADNKEYMQCVFNVALSPSLKSAYYMIRMALLYVLPLVVTVYCSCAVILEIIKLSNSANDGMRRSGVGVLDRARARTLKMTITIVAVFIICWTPYFFLYIWSTIDLKSLHQVNPVLRSSLWLFSYTNSCANPFVYGIFNIRRKNKIASTKQRNQSMASLQTIETSLRVRFD